MEYATKFMGIARSWNQIRIANQGKAFTENELKKVFRNNNIPQSKGYLQEYVNQGILLLNKGEYTFTATPVFYGLIGKACAIANAKQLEYNIKSQKKSLENLEYQKRLNEAISFLKAEGFTIIKGETL